MSSNDYDAVVKGSLKLKSSGVKKKKPSKAIVIAATKTKAELELEERQKSIKKESKPHNEKLAELNEKLAKQSDHFDMPKISGQ